MSGLEVAEQIRVQGLVQGVGFRPTVWRLARENGLRGAVWNDSQGVEIHVCGEQLRIDRFCEQLLAQPPPLARIDSLKRQPMERLPEQDEFIITESRSGKVQTGVVPDAATCDACREEIVDPANRRYRYPFTNCTHCGPRLTIVEGIPYDRTNTSMRHFPMCDACEAEYGDPADRRFHAQPNACPVCGPRVWLSDGSGRAVGADLEGEDAIAVAQRRLAEGAILAVKGIGGFHLACDAGNEEAVARLRERKGRYHKPFALMARDCTLIRNYCQLGDAGERLLKATAAPIVLLPRNPDCTLPENIAPQQTALGFMLPYSPLHHLLLAGWERPLVMTSGNRVEEPQCIDNREAAARLQPLADLFLLHDREIINRVDDSVVRIMDGMPRMLRRARGYAPKSIRLPQGFDQAPPLLALGGELKNTFCLTREGEAMLSQHVGDLENLISYRDYLKNLELYGKLFDHRPQRLVADLHPNYRSTQHAGNLSKELGVPLILVQHHHAHIASVLAENDWPLRGGKVLGIALDGSGYGADGTIWGGEFLVADYIDYQRVAWLTPIPLPGGTQAILQPWRNSFSQLNHYLGWTQVVAQWGDLEPIEWLRGQQVQVLARMIEGGVNSPLSSSCGRLFDAVAALLGICRESISYEGQAAIELEGLASVHRNSGSAPYDLQRKIDGECCLLDCATLWPSLLQDLRKGRDRGEIAWRFHLGLADGLCETAAEIAHRHGLDRVALSGGVFQNKTLFELVANRLRETGFQVLSQRHVPANDGGLALGQAAIGAARSLMSD
ncbi:MAG: carbamoyltransferase HypF [Candidatus Thiodiazotropha sp. (ex Ctena orbiculata)]|uniref:Carbamoyltransferase HypF n=1 Tax=Candidatus Thiodiazotropha taylori TaxID=2792791 RepID=A0A944MDR4_9GAMM|nr:carbamoyltransferase HypF [Candidatus Thiodiazotropha taylori]MBV2138651.1 carbamoyltransferase HypF [Candidatus Thiodiazotropha taylori]